MPAAEPHREHGAEQPSLRRAGSTTLWIGVAFASALSLLLAVALFNATRLGEARELGAQRLQVRQLLLDAKNLFSALQDAETGQRGYLLTGDESYLEPYATGVAAVARYRASIAQSNSRAQMPTFDLQGVAPRIDEKLSVLDEAIQARRRGDAAAALAIVRTGRGKQTMDQIREIIGAQMSTIEKALDLRVARNAERLRQAEAALYAGQLAAMAMIAGAFVWLRREVGLRNQALLLLQREHERVEHQVVERTAALRHSVETLRSSEAFVRAIGDNLPGGALYSLSLNDQGRPRFVYVSAGVERINGITPAAMLADAGVFYSQVIEEDRPGLLAERKRANRDGDVFQHEARLRRPDGELRWCLLTSAVRAAPDGTLLWDGIELDITERKRHEAERDAALRDAQVSEERLRLATEASNIGLWEWKPHERRIYFSPTAKRQLGYEGSDGFDSVEHWHELVHPDDHADTLRRIAATSHAPWPPYENEYRVRHRDGTYRWFRARGSMLLDGAGVPLRLLGVIEDVTELRQARKERERLHEQQLAARAEADAAHARVAQVLDSVSDAFVALDRQWRFVFVNQRAGKVFERDSAELIGREVWPELPAGAAEAFRPGFEQAMAERVFVFCEVYDTAHERWFENRIHPSEDGISVFFHDISDRKRAEIALRTTEQQLHELLAQSRRDQERERIRIARQIHDELGQQLTGVKMDLRWIERQLSEPGHVPELNPLLDRAVAASALNDEIIASVQRIAAELRPTVLDHLGLAAALRQRAREFEERSGVRCSVRASRPEPRLAPGIETELFYIVQEALTNVARHAQATQVEIEIDTAQGATVVTVCDDGVGIEPGTIEGRRSLGLLGMRERASQCGGSLHVVRVRPRGTRVSVRVPAELAQAVTP
jgi:PAS domain S-box-containing protein